MNEILKKSDDLKNFAYLTIFAWLNKKEDKFYRLPNYFFTYEFLGDDALKVTQIIALAIFDNELCIMTADPYKNDYNKMSDNELLEESTWQTLFGGNFLVLPTLLEISRIIN